MVRKIVILLGLAHGAIVPVATAMTWQEQSSETARTAGVRSVRVDNARGTIVLTRSADHDLHLTALKVIRASDSKHAERVAHGTLVLTSIEGGEYRVRVQYPQNQTVHVEFWDMFSGFELPRVEVRLALEVPDTLPVSARSTSGDVSSTGILGIQTLASTSGDVVVNDARLLRVSSTSGDVHAADIGAANLTTVSGDIGVEHPRAALRIGSTSGSVTVRGAEDSLALSTVSGDIQADAAPRGVSATSTSGTLEVRRCSGTANLISSSGDIALDLVAPFRRGEVSTSSGEVTVRLASSVGADLDLRTSNGELDCTLPLDSERVTRRNISGIVRGGTAPLVLRTASGDIHVSEAKP